MFPLPACYPPNYQSWGWHAVLNVTTAIFSDPAGSSARSLGSPLSCRGPDETVLHEFFPRVLPSFLFLLFTPLSSFLLPIAESGWAEHPLAHPLSVLPCPAPSRSTSQPLWSSDGGKGTELSPSLSLALWARQQEQLSVSVARRTNPTLEVSRPNPQAAQQVLLKSTRKQ